MKMWTNIFKWTGIIFLIFVVYFIGYVGGEGFVKGQDTPTLQQSTTYITDLQTLVSDYKTYGTLCEQKYQGVISTGDWSTADRINGQMDAIDAQAQQIESKYQAIPK